MKNLFLKIKDYFKNTILPIFTQIQWLEIPISTYVRWILVILLSINSVLTYFEINPIPFSESDIYEAVSLILNIVVLIVNTYKNNSTSKEALLADKILKALKISNESTEETAVGKLQEILIELNGDNYISKDSK